MKFDDARHFAARVGLDTHPQTIQKWADLSRADAVAKVLDELSVPRVTTPPTWAQAPPRSRRDLMKELQDKKAVQQLLRQRTVELKAWWLNEMVATPAPLAERMTLFWHNHFTTGARKVRFPALLFRQNELLRSHAGGNFRTFTRAVTRDPAMMLYLDNHRNFAGKLNENFGRELLELFTLGEGHYTDADVKAAARAFTGWTVNRRNGTFHIARRRHDAGEKTFLGKTGAWDGDDVLDIVFERPQTASRITGKLWGEFVTTPIGGDAHRRLVAEFGKDWDISAAVRHILSHEAFWAASNRGTRVKSPVELVVVTVRTLGIELDDPTIMVRICRQLGQDVFDPPNVKGWQGGNSWIASNTLLRRVQILTRTSRAASEAQQPEKWLGGVWSDDPLPLRMQRALLAVPAVQPSEATNSARMFLQQVLTDPSYQLC